MNYYMNGWNWVGLAIPLVFITLTVGVMIRMLLVKPKIPPHPNLSPPPESDDFAQWTKEMQSKS